MRTPREKLNDINQQIADVEKQLKHLKTLAKRQAAVVMREESKHIDVSTAPKVSPELNEKQKRFIFLWEYFATDRQNNRIVLRSTLNRIRSKLKETRRNQDLDSENELLSNVIPILNELYAISRSTMNDLTWKVFEEELYKEK